MSGLQNPRPRTSLFITLIVIGVFLAGAAFIPLLVRGQDAALDGSGIIRPPVMLDQAAPHLALTDLQGNPVSLGDTRGQVVLINNWATWCPPCKAEMPELQAFYQANEKQGFIIIAIESGEPVNTVAKFIQQLGLTFPVWLDPKGLALEAFRNWDLPNSYLLDRQGNLRMTWTGPINRETLEQYVTPLLDAVQE
jgi:cytochrome c biogenesis protein CcmG, thiol:disulfide interchange protein DsbE